MPSLLCNTTEGIFFLDPWAPLIVVLAGWGAVNIILFEIIEPLWWRLVRRNELKQETRQ